MKEYVLVTIAVIAVICVFFRNVVRLLLDYKKYGLKVVILITWKQSRFKDIGARNITSATELQ